MLSSEIIPRVLRLVHSCISSSNDSVTENLLELAPGSVFWLRMMETIRDPYTMERISEQILRQLAIHHVNDVQAYWVLWLLFHRIFKFQASVRSVGHMCLIFLFLKPLNVLSTVHLFLLSISSASPQVYVC